MVKKRLFAVVLLLCLAGLFVGSLEVSRVDALETTIYPLADAYVHVFVPDMNHGSMTILYAQSEIGYDKRTFLKFSLSLLPESALVTNATLRLYCYATSNLVAGVTDVQARNVTDDTWTEGGITWNNQPTMGTVEDTKVPVEVTWVEWNVTNWVQNEWAGDKTVSVGLRCVTESYDAIFRHSAYRSKEIGEAYAPQLYITYITEYYSYIVHGPYWESGAVATTIVNVTLSIMNTEPYSFILNGTAGSADTENITIEQQGIAFTWNFTTYMNNTRTYCLNDDAFEELWVFIPNTAQESCNSYLFTITDFVGVTGAFLETIHNVGGQNQIVERQSLAVINAVPFWMVWAHRYEIRLVCDQGTHNWGSFIAGAEMQQSLIIVAGMFPEDFPGLDVTVKAKRMNATWIQANYTDNQNLTSWVQVVIQYKKGHSWYTAKTYNNTGNTQQVNWYEAEAKEDYVTKVTACRNGETTTWSFSCPTPAVTDNPWDGLLEGLGTWPIPAKNVIGLFLVLAVFAVFSYANMPLGCILGVITAAFLTYIGWLDLNWNMIALAFSIGIFATIAKAKREEREI